MKPKRIKDFGEDGCWVERLDVEGGAAETRDAEQSFEEEVDAAHAGADVIEGAGDFRFGGREGLAGGGVRAVEQVFAEEFPFAIEETGEPLDIDEGGAEVVTGDVEEVFEFLIFFSEFAGEFFSFDFGFSACGHVIGDDLERMTAFVLEASGGDFRVDELAVGAAQALFEIGDAAAVEPEVVEVLTCCCVIAWFHEVVGSATDQVGGAGCAEERDGGGIGVFDDVIPAGENHGGNAFDHEAVSFFAGAEFGGLVVEAHVGGVQRLRYSGDFVMADQRGIGGVTAVESFG